jgi:hypothetical protein
MRSFRFLTTAQSSSAILHGVPLSYVGPEIPDSGSSRGRWCPHARPKTQGSRRGLSFFLGGMAFSLAVFGTGLLDNGPRDMRHPCLSQALPADLESA